METVTFGGLSYQLLIGFISGFSFFLFSCILLYCPLSTAFFLFCILWCTRCRFTDSHVMNFIRMQFPSLSMANTRL